MFAASVRDFSSRCLREKYAGEHSVVEEEKHVARSYFVGFVINFQFLALRSA